MKIQRTRALRTALSSLLILSALAGLTDFAIDDRVSLRDGESLPETFPVSLRAGGHAVAGSTATENTYYATLCGILPLKEVDLFRVGDVRLCPGGMPFGAKMFTDGLIVVAFSDIDCADGARQPAYDAGIRVQDILLEINGIPLTSAEEMAERIGAGDGSPLEILLLRDGEKMTVRITPALSESEQKYKTGMWVRDNTAGIGTVTFIDPESGAFAGLGHGICDVHSGALLPLSRGIVTDVTIHAVRRGEVGSPGELRGYFSSGKQGTLLGNTAAGVFGIFAKLPAGISAENALPIALKDEIRDGKATIYCTLDESGIHAYEVEIHKIKNAPDYKNMEVVVTDPALLAITGGIVQGMSGSPIIQNGKIIGAVTHVLVNDPTRGYGIYIENMLRAAG